MFSQREMTVIPVFWIRILLTPPRIFICRSDSPAIAAGTTDGVPVGELDLEGSPRVKSGKIDIGCYQTK